MLAPGQYEINLQKLFEREEIIIALEEDGRYVIHLPSLLKKKPKEPKE
ncbi:MAG: Zn-ribbon containing protein [Archaeoglobaceae archaeon]